MCILEVIKKTTPYFEEQGIESALPTIRFRLALLPKAEMLRQAQHDSV
jgi:hypothetical protein